MKQKTATAKITFGFLKKGERVRAHIWHILVREPEGIGYRRLYKTVNEKQKVTWNTFEKSLRTMVKDGIVEKESEEPSGRRKTPQRSTYRLKQPSPVVKAFGKLVLVDEEIFRNVILEKFADSPKKLLQKIDEFFRYCWLRALHTGLSYFKRAAEEKREKYADNLKDKGSFEVSRFSAIYTIALLELIEAMAQNEAFYKTVSERFEQKERKMKNLIRAFYKTLAKRVEQGAKEKGL